MDKILLIMVLPTIASIVSAIIIFKLQQKMAHDAEVRNQCNDEMLQAKQKETLAILKMLRSIGKLTYANSIAIKEAKVNGVMEKALSDYETSYEEWDAFIEEQTVARLHK